MPHFHLVLLVDGCPEHSSFLTNITPLLKLENQLNILSFAHCCQPNASFNILYLSVAVLSSLKQNWMHTVFS
jgi:hypothetical protein